MTKTTQTPARALSPPVTRHPSRPVGELVRQSNRWRDNYNPIRGLVIARVIYILEAADRGDFAELQLVLRKIERRYPVLKGLKARRLAALEKLDWQIKLVDELPDGATSAAAEAQQKFLRSRYEPIENLTEAIGFLATAEFRGYAILQKHRFNDGGKSDGAVRELHWLPQDQFSRDGQFGDFYYNQNSMFGIGIDSCQTVLGEQNRIGGEELPRENFVIREVESPLYEIALIAFVNWCMGRRDWAAFTEIFGLPNGVAIMPANIPPGQEDEYRAAAERVADGVSGALPNGSDIKFPTAGLRGNAPFRDFCDAQDFDVVLAGTGGRLAMLTADKGGLGNGPALEHAEAFDEIAQADARKISAVLQNDFDRVELALEFPGQPQLAYFELSAENRMDVAQLVTDVAALAGGGYSVDTNWLSEVTGFKFAAKQEIGATSSTPDSAISTGCRKPDVGGITELL
jgi:phage gp29-like protein